MGRISSVPDLVPPYPDNADNPDNTPTRAPFRIASVHNDYKLPIIRTDRSQTQSETREDRYAHGMNILSNFKRDSDVVTNASDYTAEACELALINLEHACTVVEARDSENRLEVIGSFMKRRRAYFVLARGDGEGTCDCEGFKFLSS